MLQGALGLAPVRATRVSGPAAGTQPHTPPKAKIVPLASFYVFQHYQILKQKEIITKNKIKMDSLTPPFLPDAAANIDQGISPINRSLIR